MVLVGPDASTDAVLLANAAARALGVVEGAEVDSVIANVVAPPAATLTELRQAVAQRAMALQRWTNAAGHPTTARCSPIQLPGSEQQVALVTWTRPADPAVVTADDEWVHAKRQLHDWLASTPLSHDNLDEVIRGLTSRLTELYGIERVAVWQFSDDGDELACHDLYLRSKNEHCSGEVLHASECHAEFATLRSSVYVDMHDTESDPRAAGYREGYTRPNGISSMLDAAIRFGGRCHGALCFEHTGAPKVWTPQEIDFACTIASYLATAFESLARTEAEALAREQQRFVTAVLEGSPIGIQVFTPEGRSLRRNRALCVLLGLEPDRLAEEPTSYNLLRDLADQPDGRSSGFVRALSGEPSPIERREFDFTDEAYAEWGTRRDSFWIEHVFFPVFDAADDVEAVVAFVWEISDRIRSEREHSRLEGQLRQSQKLEAVGRLAGGVAHDFNNILTTVVGFTDLLRMQIEPGEEAAEIVNQLRRSAERGTVLTKQLLTFGRVHMARIEVFDASEVVVAMAPMLQRLLEANVHIDVHANVVASIRADRGQFQQLLLNLLLNARDAMLDGGKVTVTVETNSANEMRLTVQDTGCGMDEATKARVFEPFFTTKPAGQGSGLGLSTVYGIVSEAGGHIAVESEPDRGTTVIVRWPLAPAESPANRQRTIPPAATPDETVLVVEDDEANRSIASRVLQKRGYTVFGGTGRRSRAGAGGGEQAHRSAADRRRHAGHRRPRAGRADDPCAPGAAHRLHQRIHQRRRAPPRRARGHRQLPAEAVLAAATGRHRAAHARRLTAGQRPVRLLAAGRNATYRAGMAQRLALLASLAALAPALTAQEDRQTLDASLLAGLEARAIGPAVCGGRIGAVASVPGDPTIIWAGAASGGVWKSTDGGVRFEPVFDDQDVASIGAIAIDPRSPDIVWVGSGEGNPRNSASVGRGIYRTTDAGRTWQKLGLEKTERIHRIVLHPDTPSTAWVAAFGTSWGENEQRGIFKTTDSGATWKKVLYVDERTGGADLVIDPRNPDKLFASMWQHRRWPYAFESGGPGSGLYRSLDGGETWTQLGVDDGLPKGELGRIGLAIAPSEPRIVYALTEAKKSVLLRSDDGGLSFRIVNSENGIAPRPFYFCDIRVDPRDPDRVYNMHTVIEVSNDGGRSFGSLVAWSDAHPDHHSMWIDPVDPERILIGNDGGVYTSRDRGASWRFCANLPLAQFYHVAVDDDVPYHIYGGLQDNGSWRGPSTVWENGGIRNLHWQEVCFGDGFATVPDPDDSRTGYAMSQGGGLVRWDVRTGSKKSIRPPAPDGVDLRFHWNAAIAIDPYDAATVYYGSQFVHRSQDRGESWELLSPDLTTDNPEWQQQDQSGGLTRDVTAAENHCSILTIAPSAVARGVLWVGTDDGRVHVTRDGGESWTSVEANVPDLPANTWCPHIEASKHDAASAYAVFDGHRNADWTSYVYVTRDYGATWTALANDGVIDGYCHCIEQDPVQKNLLWVGTEFGLFATLDGGSSWHRWSHGVPTCAVRAIATHDRTGDLIVGTHGRALFVVDDISPLRTLTAATLAARLHVFAPRAAIAHAVAQSPGTRFPGSGEFRGPTRPRGVMLHVVANGDGLQHPDPDIAKQIEAAEQTSEQASREDEQADDAKTGDDKTDDGESDDEVVVEVRDTGGELLRTFRRKVKQGLNRVVWRLERDGTPRPSREWQPTPKTAPAGREVPPGNYELTVRFRGETRVVAATVLPDPRVAISAEDRTAKDALRARRDQLRERLYRATQRLARCKREIGIVTQRLAIEDKPHTGDDPWQSARDALKAVNEALRDTEERLWGERVEQGISRDADGLIARATAMLSISSTHDAPNATELLKMDRATERVPAVREAVDAFVSGPLAEFRTAVADSGLALLPSLDPVDDQK